MEVPVIGNIPTQLPAFQAHRLLELEIDDLQSILTPAVMLGGLGVIDSLLTSMVADNLTKTRHNSRYTIIGQGVGNLFAAVFGGLPGAGATMGTVTNMDQSGMVTLQDIISDWQRRGIQVYVTGASDMVIEGFQKKKLMPETLYSNQLFESFEDCVEQLPQLLIEQKEEFKSE